MGTELGRLGANEEGTDVGREGCIDGLTVGLLLGLMLGRVVGTLIDSMTILPDVSDPPQAVAS